jgi:hypothetical protein
MRNFVYKCIVPYFYCRSVLSLLVLYFLYWHVPFLIKFPDQYLRDAFVNQFGDVSYRIHFFLFDTVESIKFLDLV